MFWPNNQALIAFKFCYRAIKLKDEESSGFTEGLGAVQDSCITLTQSGQSEQMRSMGIKDRKKVGCPP